MNNGEAKGRKGLRENSRQTRPTDPFDPRLVRQTTRAFGLLAIGYLLATMLIDLWPLFRDTGEVGLGGWTERDFVFAFAALAGGFFVWIAAEIWVSQKGWATGVLMVFTAMDAAWTVLQFLSREVTWYWPYLSVAAAGAAFMAFRGARQIAAGKVAADDESEFALADSGLSKAGAGATISPREKRRLVPILGILAAIIVAGLGGYILATARAPIASTPEPTAASETAAAAPAEAVANSSGAQIPPANVIPAAELAGLYNLPNPATVEAVVARARELCGLQGSQDRAITFDELREMAGGKVAAFDAADRRGFQRTASDEACYRDAKALLRDYNADGSQVGEELDPEAAVAEGQ